MVRISEEVYTEVSQWSVKEMRSISNAMDYLLRKGMQTNHITENKFVPKAPNPETGYACCEGKSPCKHWQWDSVSGEGYINILTGKRREV